MFIEISENLKRVTAIVVSLNNYNIFVTSRIKLVQQKHICLKAWVMVHNFNCIRKMHKTSAIHLYHGSFDGSVAFQGTILQLVSHHIPLKAFFSIINDTSHFGNLKYLPHLFWKRISYQHVDNATAEIYWLGSTFVFVDDMAEELSAYFPSDIQDILDFSLRHITYAVES